MISKELKLFFVEWLEWATQQKVEDTRNFHKDQGLCSSLQSWAVWNKHDSVALGSELIALLERDFKGNYQFPFDKSLPAYWQVKVAGKHHKNQQRLVWVKKMIGT